MTQPYPKRLIEVDLPIKRISAHARREKSTHHGHISTLHIWWARRPLAACRAVILASLWPDPVTLVEWHDDATIKPDRFLKVATDLMWEWAKSSVSIIRSEDGDLVQRNRAVSAASEPSLVAAKKDPDWLYNLANLRTALLDFIADFADWDNSTDADFLSTA